MTTLRSSERIIGADLALDQRKIAFDLNGTCLNIKDDEDYNIEEITVLPNTRDFISRLRDRGFVIVAHTAAFFNRIDQLNAADPNIIEPFEEIYTRESSVNVTAPRYAGARIGRDHLLVRQRNNDPVALRWRYVTLGSDLSPENREIAEKAAEKRNKVPAITGAAYFYDDYNPKIRQFKDPMPQVKILKPTSIPATGKEQEAYITTTFGVFVPR